MGGGRESVRLAALRQALAPPSLSDSLQQLHSGLRPEPVMHSSGVRSENFSITDRGRPLELSALLPDIDRHTRVGIVAPLQGTEAAGAATLVLAMITAFYNDLRENDRNGGTLAGDPEEERRRGGDYFAYPDFYVFQPPCRRDSPASYSMFDVWPSHKWVAVDGGRPVDWLRAVTDHGINVLLVADDTAPVLPPPTGDYSSPDSADHRLDVDPSDPYARIALHSAKRTIRHCWAYSSEGHATDGDVFIAFDPHGNPDSGGVEGGGDLDLASWIHTVFTAEREEPLPLPSQLARTIETARRGRGGVIEQSYRRLPLEEALTML